jgi:hypothetical protein
MSNNAQPLSPINDIEGLAMLEIQMAQGRFELPTLGL